MTVYNNKKGFTIIELIVVVTITGILAPGMIMIFSNILDNYRTMSAIVRVTKSSEYVLHRFTEDMNNCKTIKRADVKEIEVEIETDPVQSYRYKIDDTDGTIKLCVSSCDDAQNFHTMIKGVKSTSEFKYLGADLNELENDPAKPWRSSNAGHYAKLNGIMFVELKLDLVFRDGTTSYFTVVYPEAKVLLE